MTHRVLRLRALTAAGLSVLTAAALGAGTADAQTTSKPVSSPGLQLRTTPTGINAHLKKLQRIASAYGGNRFAGTPGYDASAQYVYDTLEKAGYEPQFDEFTYTAFNEVSPTTFSKNGVPYAPVTEFGVLEYSGPGDVTGTAVKVDGLGCTAADVPAGSIDQIAVINRGSCSFREKVDSATSQGYGGVVIVNNEPGPLNGTLGAEGGASQIPAVGVPTEVGNAIAAGDTLQIVTDTTTEELTTRNVIAETAGGNPDNVVMVGAHLDSVIDGPGINDNGSGSAAILEIARQLAKAKAQPKNKLRFAWWSAEESGLVGATDYVSRLSPEDQLRIGLYLNFDMVGSPNFARFIYDGDDTLGSGVEAPPGSDAIEANFEKFFARKRQATEPTAFDGRSDYGPFIDVGIPSGGLFTGAEEVKTPEQVELYGGTAGVAFDPNYHQAGDTFANVSQQAIDEQSNAIADAVATYANSTRSVDDQDDEAARIQAAKPMEYSGEARVR